MAEDRNTFLNADSIYEEVEEESGVQLTLEEDQQRNLIGIIKGRYAQAEEARQTDETRWLKAYENYSCPKAASTLVLVTFTKTLDFSDSLNLTLLA